MTPLLDGGSPEACCTPGAHGGAAASNGQRSGAYVTITSTAGDFECYVSFPLTHQPVKGAMILAHDIFGLRSGRHAQICDELAAAGYITACPDLFGDGRSRAADLNFVWPIKSLRNILDLICCCKMRLFYRCLLYTSPSPRDS